MMMMMMVVVEVVMVMVQGINGKGKLIFAIK
jgi:hypothetical protein